MATNDPIADMLTRIRNAKSAEHKYVDVQLTKIVKNIAEVLVEQGFVKNYIANAKDRKLRIFLKYAQGRQSVIQSLKRVSKLGGRKYVGYKDIPRVLGGMGISIMSTPLGVMDGEAARKKRVGGEILCYVT